MKRFLIPFFILVLIGAGAFVYQTRPDFLFPDKGIEEITEEPEEQNQKDSNNQDQQVNFPNSEPSNPPEELQTFKNEYTNQEEGYSIEYPEDINVEEKTTDFVWFYKFGPTQQKNTEFYDGISIRIRREVLEKDMTLEDKAQELAEQDRSLGEVTQEVTEASLGGIEGYIYSSKTVGTETTTYLLKYPNSDKYLHVINGTADPENQGFNKTARDILNTIELN